MTLPKSLLVANEFPAREWVQQRSLQQLHVSRVEWALIVLSVLLLTAAAVMEAFSS